MFNINEDCSIWYFKYKLWMNDIENNYVEEIDKNESNEITNPSDHNEFINEKNNENTIFNYDDEKKYENTIFNNYDEKNNEKSIFNNDNEKNNENNIFNDFNKENEISNDNKNENEKEKNLNKKRGRKKTNEKKKDHTKNCKDNQLKKIKAHFHKFILCFFNLLIRKFYGFQKYSFLKGIYRLDKTNPEFKEDNIFIGNDITKKTNRKLINISLKEFLKQEVSPKCSRHEKNENNKIFEEKLNKKFINEYNYLFQTSYKDFYKNYYLKFNENDDLIIELQKENLKLKKENQKIKNFDDLIINLSFKEKKEYINEIIKIGNSYVEHFEKKIKI
jgi:hypothetical protein